MRRVFVLCVLIIVLVQGCDRSRDCPHEIVGEWKLISLFVHGVPWIQEEGKESTTIFSEDMRFEIQVGGSDAGRGVYKLDGLNLDMIFEPTSNRSEAIVKYIFSIENKTLSLCNYEDGIRPSDFNLTTNSVFQVLEREVTENAGCDN